MYRTSDFICGPVISAQKVLHIERKAKCSSALIFSSAWGLMSTKSQLPEREASRPYTTPTLGAAAGAAAFHAAVAAAVAGHDGSAGAAAGGVAHVVEGLHGGGGVEDAAVGGVGR